MAADNYQSPLLSPMGSTLRATRSGRPPILVMWVVCTMVAIVGLVVASPLADAWPTAVRAKTEEVPAPGRFIAVGDSIMLGAKTELGLRADFLGWPAVLDMEVSRSTSAGADALASHAPDGSDVVVLSLGANDSGDAELFRSRVRQVVAVAQPAAHVYWLTIPEVRPYYPAANNIIREELASYPNMTMIDWSAVTSDTPGLTSSDGLHLTPAGSRAMADTIIWSVLADAVAAMTPTTTAPPVAVTTTTAVSEKVPSGSGSAEAAESGGDRPSTGTGGAASEEDSGFPVFAASIAVIAAAMIALGAWTIIRLRRAGSAEPESSEEVSKT